MAFRTRTYRGIYEVEITHDKLNKYRLIRGSDSYIVRRKARAQLAQWEEQWERQQVRDKIAQEKERERRQLAKQKEAAERQKEKAKALALEKTLKAQEVLDALGKTLTHTLTIHDAIDWDSLKDNSEFPESFPKEHQPTPPKYKPLPDRPFPYLPEQPDSPIKPDEPSAYWAEFQPVFTILDRLFPALARRKERIIRRKFSTAHTAWVERCNEIDRLYDTWKKHCEEITFKNDLEKSAWQEAQRKARDEYTEAVTKWKERKREFEKEQAANNAIVNEKQQQYLSGEQGAVLDYCDMVLSNSIYPDFFPREWVIDYSSANKTIIVDYKLPNIDDIPTLKSIKYVQSHDEFKEVYISEKEKKSLYESVLYQVSLRTIHELYEADVVGALDTIAFNGMVTSIDKSSGNEVTACVLSVLVCKDAFLEINLANIDPKACFKSLKGVAAAALATMTPVAPILVMDREDKRFIAGNSIIDDIGKETNLAAMPWEDFEHLIREVFEQEFATGGGEVKVTRASRDGGVDAIAFDPDPIRGGKIVIQAKRYTNTVGVAAVRDLYGTVINEGAIKGVLVTTATYGPDAYEFAQGKPLTLLNGSNLLHLLERHGHKARIDIQKARKTT